MHDHSYRVGLARSLLLAAVAVAALMAGFEVLKQFLFPRISLWQSHAATIVFSTIVATLATYLLGRKLIASNAKLQDDIRKREWMSKALEQSEARYRSLFERNQAATERDCPACTLSIPVGARRCPECTTEISPATEVPHAFRP